MTTISKACLHGVGQLQPNVSEYQSLVVSKQRKEDKSKVRRKRDVSVGANDRVE